MPLNTTGTPNTDLYALGRGRLYIAELTSGVPGGYRDMGNSPKVSAEVSSETLDHYTSRLGTKTIDKSVVLTQEINLSIECDEISFQNIAEFLSGTASSGNTNPAVAGITKYSWITSVELGKHYQIKTNASPGVQARDIASANLTLEVGATTLVLGTDYTVDEKNGTVFFLTTAANVTDTDTVDLTLAPDAGAVSINRVQGLTTTNRTVAVRFIRVNPVDSKETVFDFHQVILKGDGAFDLVGDDWQKLSYTGKAEYNTTFAATCTIEDHANS